MLAAHQEKFSHRDQYIADLRNANSELQKNKELLAKGLDDLIAKLQEVEAARDTALKKKADVNIVVEEVKSKANTQKA